MNTLATISSIRDRVISLMEIVVQYLYETENIQSRNLSTIEGGLPINSSMYNSNGAIQRSPTSPNKAQRDIFGDYPLDMHTNPTMMSTNKRKVLLKGFQNILANQYENIMEDMNRILEGINTLDSIGSTPFPIRSDSLDIGRRRYTEKESTPDRHVGFRNTLNSIPFPRTQNPFSRVLIPKDSLQFTYIAEQPEVSHSNSNINPNRTLSCKLVATEQKLLDLKHQIENILLDISALLTSKRNVSLPDMENLLVDDISQIRAEDESDTVRKFCEKLCPNNNSAKSQSTTENRNIIDGSPSTLMNFDILNLSEESINR